MSEETDPIVRKEYEVDGLEITLEEGSFPAYDEETNYRMVVDMTKDDFLERIGPDKEICVYGRTEEWEDSWSTDPESLMNDGRYGAVNYIESDNLVWDGEEQRMEMQMGPEFYTAVSDYLESLD